MRLVAVLLLAGLLIAGCSGTPDTSNDANATQPINEEIAPVETEGDSLPDTPMDLEQIAAGFEQGMACEDALAQMPPPTGSFSSADVIVEGMDLPIDEDRVNYVWELESGGIMLTCLDGQVLGVTVE